MVTALVTFCSGRGWKLLGLPGLPADLPGGWVVTALVTFCSGLAGRLLGPLCLPADWLGGPGHFLLLQHCLRHLCCGFWHLLHVLGPRALRRKDL